MNLKLKIYFYLCFDMPCGTCRRADDIAQDAINKLGKGNVFSANLGQSTYYESRGNPVYQGGGMVKSDSNCNKESTVGNKPERSSDNGADNVLFNPRF